jgi:N6-L-threonylcarbamoyladenine synthase
VQKYEPKTLVLAGGVAANTELRQVLKTRVDEYNHGLNLLVPQINLCGDNAAMIGIAAYYHLQKGDISTWKNIEVDSNLELGSRS